MTSQFPEQDPNRPPVTQAPQPPQPEQPQRPVVPPQATTPAPTVPPSKKTVVGPNGKPIELIPDPKTGLLTMPDANKG